MAGNEQQYYRPGMYALIQESRLHGKGRKAKKAAKPKAAHISIHGKGRSQPHHHDVYGHGKGAGKKH